MKTKFLILPVLCLVLLNLGCERETDDALTTNNGSDVSLVTLKENIEADAKLDIALNELSPIIENPLLMAQLEALSNSATSRTVAANQIKILPDCATVTTTTTIDVTKITINFGTQNCTLFTGSSARGKVTIILPKESTTETKKYIFRFDNFVLNGNRIDGTLTSTYVLTSTITGTIPRPLTTYNINITVLTSKGQLYTKIGIRIREQVGGFTTVINYDDDVFKIFGSTTTTMPDGTDYSFTIKDEPLLLKLGCKNPFPVSGKVYIEKDKVKATLDYGQGNCDNLAKLSLADIISQLDFTL